jgi:MYXO-CTERM domain-containing protein
MLSGHITMQKTTLLLMLLSWPAHADTHCTPSRLLIVLDKSSSMNDSVDATGDSKWKMAKQAITEVATQYENKIDLGLNIFPNPNQCAPGKTVVTPAPGNAAAIVAAFGNDPPAGGNYTPMAQSIDAAAADASLADATRRPTILLVTDGWQWCSPYDPATRPWPIDAVKRAKASGIAVYVVGFGKGVDVDTLNQMALEAGTSLAGCDPMDAAKKCYFQADSAADLLNALDTVGVTISAEICDGLDNDCDGQVDEDLTRDCASVCGSGHETCNAGNWEGCTAPLPTAESCDGKDNDCDGQIDEDLVCAECHPGDVKDCGACADKVSCRDDGTFAACPAPPADVCNGKDDDCDGEIDNGPTAQLCPDGGVCLDGKCQQPAAAPSQPDGCGCKIGGPNGNSDGNLLAAVMLLAAGAWIIRRRRA